jgi:molybdopterin converting factor small subunit
MNNIGGYKCIDCDKIYSSYKSLWNHNNKYHENRKTETFKESKTYECRICSKEYKHLQSRHTHEKTCSIIKINGDLEVEKMKQETEKMKQETLDKEQETIKLKIKLQSMKRIDNKTFKAINKLLMDRSTTNTQNNINNTIINNYNFPQIKSLGNENVVETLSMYDKKLILDRRLCSLDKMIEIVHCGDHNMFKNIIITNLKDKFAYRYDEAKGYFITTTKNDVLDDLVSNRIMDIEAIYDELSTANKIDIKTKKLIQEFLDKMENEKPFMYGEIDQNFKSYKMNNIKILLYNNQDKITKDIALLIGDKVDIIPKVEILNDINIIQ